MRLSLLAVLGFAFIGVASTQTKDAPPSTPAPTSGPPVNTGPASPSTQPSTAPDNSRLNQPPIFISGRVMLSDGTPLTDRAKIERVCNSRVIVETETDRKGSFNFEVGHSMELPDASVGFDPSSSGPGPMFNSRNISNRMSNTETQLWGCELRASLAGFRSDVIQLGGIRYMDNPNVGTIILHRIAKVDGLTISVVSALAPKEARKAYEKGREAESKRNLEEARKNFEKAVNVYPQYSAAWFELGRINQLAGRPDEARKSYQQAIAAEPKFISPREQLSWLALREEKWEELVALTDQWLRLDPLNSSEAYYLNSIGNLQTQHLDVAEKNAREAIRMDPGKKNIRARYILGLVLATHQDFAEAAEAIQSYLDATPDGKERTAVQKQLEQIQEAGQQKEQSKIDQPKQE